jgi:hypothetical protein
MPRKNTSEFTTIGIRRTTRDRLKHFARKVEMYDDIINRLLDIAEDQENRLASRESPKKYSKKGTEK